MASLADFVKQAAVKCSREKGFMRKVFLSTMMLYGKTATKYISRDFAIGEKQFYFPISYLINNEVQQGDEVLIITSVEHGASGEAKNRSEANYQDYQKEVEEILATRAVTLRFEEIVTTERPDATSFTTFFKKITRYFEDGDEIYADFTFGLKAYTLAMFTAMTYVVRSSQNIKMRCMMYSQKYTGSTQIGAQQTAELLDISSIYYINEIAGNSYNGQRAGLDKIFDMIITD